LRSLSIGQLGGAQIGNQFLGSIPTELCALTDLIRLALDNNLLTGTIPECLGSSLTNLAQFVVQNNSLEGTIPTSFQKLTMLELLDFAINNFTGTFLDDWIENFSSLKQLSFNRNNFDGTLPSSLASLTNLELLSGSRNNFSGPLPELGNAPKLWWIDCAENQLTGTISISFSNLTGLGKRNSSGIPTKRPCGSEF
jgi:Leucine-rich repeat (LRR) protein